MRRRIDLLSGILGCLILLLSCDSQSSESPFIQFISPEINSIHDLTTELDVEIDIKDDFMIMEYRFWLVSDSGLEYFTDSKQKINQSNYTIHYVFDLSTNIDNDFTIHLEAIDNDGNKAHEKLKVSVYK
ncbi:MAG: hypothetical protein P1U56_25705 [Saprospiraceae bacterium]|nr:hypothetical protein [Saprospiraceae bacterium]